MKSATVKLGKNLFGLTQSNWPGQQKKWHSGHRLISRPMRWIPRAVCTYAAVNAATGVHEQGKNQDV
jgi:hypothetical protein